MHLTERRGVDVAWRMVLDDQVSSDYESYWASISAVHVHIGRRGAVQRLTNFFIGSQSESVRVLMMQTNDGHMPKILESCYSTWIFDLERMRYRRLLRDLYVGDRPVTTQWRRFYRLVEDERAFTVELNQSGSRRIRCTYHTGTCEQCGASVGSEAHAEDNALAMLASAS